MPLPWRPPASGACVSRATVCFHCVGLPNSGFWTNFEAGTGTLETPCSSSTVSVGDWNPSA